MKKLIATGLAMSLLVGTGASVIPPKEVSAATTTKVATASKATKQGYTFTAQQKQALAEVNKVRKNMGLLELKLNPYLNKSAQNHANYLTKNGNSSGHDEKKGKSGFTGVDVEDRVASAGGKKIAEYSTEVISFSTSNIKAAVQNFIDTAYHRLVTTNVFITEMGVGVSGKNVVINLLVDYSNIDELEEKEYVYPYNNQKNVGIGFYGFEDPNPLEQFNVKRSGQIISVQGSSSKFVMASLTDSKGADVPFYSEAYGGGDWFFYPKQELAYGETYTVNVSYTKSYDNKLRNKKWKFTTVKKPTVKLVTGENHLKVNGKYISVKRFDKQSFDEYNYSPITKKKVTYVEAKTLFTRLNAKMTTNTKTKTHTITSEKKTIKYTEGKKTVTVNGKSVKITELPYKKGSSLYVPLSFITKTTGGKAKLDSKNRVVSIDVVLQTPKAKQYKVIDKDY